MSEALDGFDWDAGNRAKCQKHGVSLADVEALFSKPLLIVPDTRHSKTETRIRALGKTGTGQDGHWAHDISGIYRAAESRAAPNSPYQRALYAR